MKTKHAETARWIKLRLRDYGRVEEFLRAREGRCVSACARFLRIKSGGGEVWALRNSGEKDAETALLIYSHNTIFPVFDSGAADPANTLPPPPFLGGGIFGKAPPHAVHGPAQDAAALERSMEKRGFIPVERIDYDLMALDEAPPPACFSYGPPGLVIRPPLKNEEDKIYFLQAAYELEEVLPRGAVFYPASCRAGLERILNSERILVACIGPELVGKINTNAVSFSRYQIGGVYVHPEYRGRGIASRMTAVFLDSLRDMGAGMGATLFVKKSNPQAKAVYARAGFTVRDNYRISYF